MAASVMHETFVLERVFSARPQAVFNAYADVKAREVWSAPSKTAAVVYSESDFRVGGWDHYRCGAKADLRYSGSVHYEDIVPDQRIVLVESIRAEEALLCVSIVTWELSPFAPPGSELSTDEGGTRLVLTDQLVSLVGKEMVDGSRVGTSAALENLGAWLESRR